MKEYVLTIACPDVAGIAAAVTGFIAKHDGFITASNQFGDPATGQFFQRICFHTNTGKTTHEELKTIFQETIATPFKMNWAIHDMARKPRVLMMVSKYDHCLNALLYRHQSGTLKIEIPAIISNHENLRKLAEWHQIPFYHLPVNKSTKLEQEAEVWKLICEHEVDLVVLARYMQILSAGLCGKLEGKAINIHHSFLPSFKGAKPYHQAHARGVKLIGATAHYVTTDLDEGPIIEQEVARVNHTMSPEELVSMGQDIESRVLARAVRYHCEHRVLLNEHKTVVFN